MIHVRREQPSDLDAVRVVNQQAFGQPLEAALVDALREIEGVISLVATTDAQIVGHILFSPVRIEHTSAEISATGLAPMAVLPEFQKRGIGSALITAGLDACREQHHDLVVVLGHPEYYPRFGFVVAAAHGLSCEYPAPVEAFMVLELRTGSLSRAKGLVRYRPEFAAFA